MCMNKQKLYLKKISRTCRNFRTVSGNHGTIAEHDNFTQHWNILDFGVKSQILFDEENIEIFYNIYTRFFWIQILELHDKT